MKKQLKIHSHDAGSGGDLMPGEYEVKKGQILSLPEKTGECSISCLSGLLWITQENDPGDHIIAQDSVFDPDRAGLIVIEAIADSVLRLSINSKKDEDDSGLHEHAMSHSESPIPGIFEPWTHVPSRTSAAASIGKVIIL
jgi:hypothetical protein